MHLTPIIHDLFHYLFLNVSWLTELHLSIIYFLLYSQFNSKGHIRWYSAFMSSEAVKLFPCQTLFTHTPQVSVLANPNKPVIPGSSFSIFLAFQSGITSILDVRWGSLWWRLKNCSWSRIHSSVCPCDATACRAAAVANRLCAQFQGAGCHLRSLS